MDRLTVLFLKFLQYVHQLQLFIWWLLELHVIKIVSSYIIWVSVKEVSSLEAIKRMIQAELTLTLAYMQLIGLILAASVLILSI